MVRISEQTIENIRSKADILDVVSGYVTLKRRGRNHFGLCPFHQEKTGSFSVNAEKQIYHCFGCGQGGGAINFIMEMEKLEFVEAVQFLADRYGVPLEIEGGAGRPKELMTQLAEIQEFAARHFVGNLKTPKGLEIQQYFENRGIKPEIVRKFRLGYSDDGWTSLLDKVRQEKFSSDALKQSGLFTESQKGYFDRFRGRIMFTLQNAQSKIVGFAGRVYEGDDPAKYVNSPETPLYNKSKILYGLWASKEALRNSETVIVVEGYLDYLQLYQAGIENVVAVSGTAFTDQHARELRKFTNTVAVAYDGDSAGVNAAIRAGYVLLRNGLTPTIVAVPKDIDPDDWVKKEGPEPLLLAVKNASDLIRFQFDLIEGDLNDPAVKSRYVKEVLTELVQMSDTILRELYLGKIAELSGVKEQTLYNTMEAMLARQRQRQPMAVPSAKTETVADHGKDKGRRIEDELLQMCFVDDEDIRKLIYKYMNVEWLGSASSRRIFDAVFIHLPSEMAPEVSTILNSLEQSGDQRKTSALIFGLEQMKPTVDMAKDCLIRLESNFVKNQVLEKRARLKQPGLDAIAASQILTELDILQRQAKNIPNKYRSDKKC